MGILKKLFGPREGDSSPTNAATPTIINQGDADAPLRIDPATISHAFVALTLGDMAHSDKVAGKIADLNRHCQPRLWSVQFNAKFVTFAVNEMNNGFPDPTGVGPALDSVGLKPPYSVVINSVTISLDGGKTNTKVIAGFAYHDLEPKIVAARNDGCVPK